MGKIQGRAKAIRRVEDLYCNYINPSLFFNWIKLQFFKSVNNTFITILLCYNF